MKLTLPIVLVATLLVAHANAQPPADVGWLTGDAQVQGVEYYIYNSTAAKTRVSYHVYFPPNYDSTKSRYPVLYWLHGTGGGTNGIGPVARHFDDAIRAGKIPPMLIVFVNGRTARLWSDSKDGTTPVETVFVKELIPVIDLTFKTIADRRGRIIEGFSMGGYGAGSIGFKHPETFGGISMLAAGPLDPEFKGPRAIRNTAGRARILQKVCSNDLEYFKSLNPRVPARKNSKRLTKLETAVRVACGANDESLTDIRAFHNDLTAMKIRHEFLAIPDAGHNAQRVLAVLNHDNVEFYSSVFGSKKSEMELRKRGN